MRHKHGVGISHASFGEILQGRFLSDKKSFLVTLPVDKFAKAFFYPDSEKRDISVFPEYKSKAKKAVDLFREHINSPIGGTLYIESEIPEGKGLSSSSADLVASMRAFADSLNLIADNHLLGKIMAKIEPSDGVMYDSTVVYYNLEGGCGPEIESIPEFTIIGVDDGGTVNTLDCYKNAEKRSLETLKRQEKLLTDLIDAANRGSLADVGKVSTESALLNQDVIHKKCLEDLLVIKDRFNLPGIVTSHTGTYIGLIIEHDSNYLNIVNKVTSLLVEKQYEFTIFKTKSILKKELVGEI
ncbi:hypothetical protein [Exiguobacterium sp. s189]|uniref:GHMP family kinase ATP-binding protein n=1 Tax=Exiguobacterium sp. s189 TaxID=2751263 RepID=UPI001BE7C125|nr:hypothetical protein [Exiguobacterium sp. s189]